MATGSSGNDSVLVTFWLIVKHSGAAIQYNYIDLWMPRTYIRSSSFWTGMAKALGMFLMPDNTRSTLPVI